MNLIKLGLNTMTVPAKIQFGRQVVTAMQGNPNFSTPNPPLPVMTGSCDAVEGAYNDAQSARQTAKQRTSVQDDTVAAWDTLITQLALYVENVAVGDKTMIESAGFTVRNVPAPVGLPPAPTNVTVLPSQNAGSADLSWDSERGYVSFLIERAEDAPVPSYEIIGTATKKEASLNSMVSGKKYWFRVASVGPAGQSAWSDPVPLFAP
jgi:hypothetical protein